MQTPDLIQLYGRTYARTKAAAVATLFQPDGTASGFYRVTCQGVYLSDLQGRERLFIRADGLGPVSVSRGEDGRARYMFSAASNDEAAFGIPASVMARDNGARDLARQLFPRAAH